MSDGRFSRRTDWPAEPSHFSLLCRAAPRPLIDLTESNPTRCGLGDAQLVALLGDPRGARYQPDPRGLAEARAAVCRYYAARAIDVAPDAVLLAASTSEAYGWLFKLLCDPGDAVLAPAPAYPLLPFLAQLEEVRLAPYPLLRDEGWRIDLSALARALDETRARAVVVVHPGNPTGAFTRRNDAARLHDLCAERGAPLLIDEVFADYPHGALPADRLPSFAAGGPALSFVFSGLSKVALAPQLKLAWLCAVGGAEDTRREALGRLEIIGDSYLSVATPVQLALPAILDRAPALQRAVRRRLGENLAVLDAAVAARGVGCPVARLPVDGGWYALVQLPRTKSDDDWLRETIAAGVLVHPGYFFDMRETGVMVVSLLCEPGEFARGIDVAVRLWSAG